MINRSLIRIRVFQELFTYFERENSSLPQSENRLFLSLDKINDLYFHFFSLISELTVLHEKRLEKRKEKFLQTDEDRNPNLRLLNNRLVKMLRESPLLQEFQEEKGFLWSRNEEFNVLKGILNDLEASDIYKKYKESEDTFEEDLAFWIAIFSKQIFKNKDLEEFLEDEDPVLWASYSLFIENMGVEILPRIDEVEQKLAEAKEMGDYRVQEIPISPVRIQKEFFLKTLRTIKKSEGKDLDSLFLPQYRDEEDYNFAKELLRSTVKHAQDHKQLIIDLIENWSIDRLVKADLYIIMMGITEMLMNNNIPINVTINECLEISKMFSTTDSSKFVNGVLDKAYNRLKEEKKIFKI